MSFLLIENQDKICNQCNDIFLSGCSAELATRLQYAFEKVETMIQSSNKSSASHTNQNIGISSH